MALAMNVLESQETFPAIIERLAQSDPDRPFVRTIDGSTLTWSELRSAKMLWADRFNALGVQRGSIVSTILDAGADSLPIWLGLVSLGAVDATINCEFRGRMLSYAVDTCQPNLIVVDHRYLQLLEAVANDIDKETPILVVGGGADIHFVGSPFPNISHVSTLSVRPNQAEEHLVEISWQDTACITFTSGTTGPSKAVRIPWAQLNSINLGTYPFEDLNSSDIFYCFTAHAHFGSKSLPYLAAMVGGEVVIRPRFSLKAFWEDIGRYNITTASLVGTMADMLMRGSMAPPEWTTLKNMFMAPLGSSYREFAARFDLRICTVYNSTELGVPICSGWNPPHENTVGRLRKGYPDFEVRIVDENDFELPDGSAGECIVRSSVPWTLNAGYHRNLEATALAWRNGWFHTGDALMRTLDGDYVFVDRLKDVIRRRGENISSFEVEADVKINAHVFECAAIGVPSETSEDEILLFVSLFPNSPITVQDLCADLEARMTRFMVPRYVEVIDEFPKTAATERIIKAELRRRGLGPQTWDRERGRLLGESV